MKPNTCLVIDVWEGSLEMDEAVLKANGVAGIGIRINDMNGGHHQDVGFKKQWAEAANFVRFPYFVYNPWVDGEANFNWLLMNMPVEAKSVAVDIEVKFTGITPAIYSREVTEFLALCKHKGWKTIIYTGQWFLNALSSWPDCDYWWAQYPDPANYFSGIKNWDALKLALDNVKLARPFNESACPGEVKLWQFTGDYLILPGTIRDIDVNLFFGSETELAEYFGAPQDSDPDVPPVVTQPDLFTFSKAAYWARPAGGPLVTPHYNTTKAGTDKEEILGESWISWMRTKLSNTAKMWGKIIAPDWGPSKGFNSKGKLIFNCLVYPGRNVVRVKQVVTGLDGQQWGELDALDLDTQVKIDSSVNHIDTPHLIHTVYGSNTKWTWFPLANSPRVPLLGTGKRWIEMKWLEKIALPRTVTVTAYPGLNVRINPGDLSTKKGAKSWREKVEITELTIAKGGIWGRVKEGWIALRFQDKNLTDWEI